MINGRKARIFHFLSLLFLNFLISHITYSCYIQLGSQSELLGRSSNFDLAVQIQGEQILYILASAGNDYFFIRCNSHVILFINTWVFSQKRLRWYSSKYNVNSFFFLMIFFYKCFLIFWHVYFYPWIYGMFRFKFVEISSVLTLLIFILLQYNFQIFLTVCVASG